MCDIYILLVVIQISSYFIFKIAFAQFFYAEKCKE